MSREASTEASAVRIRPGTIDDNEACAAVLVDAINDLGRRNGSIDEGDALEHETQWPRWRSFFDRRHELGAEKTEFEVALHNGIAVEHLLGRGYRMDSFMTQFCSSEPFGRFDRYLFCGPALIL